MEGKNEKENERGIKIMALRSLMLRKQIDDVKKSLEAVNAKEGTFAKREAELEIAIAEASTDEEKNVVENAVDAFEKEKADTAAEKERLESKVNELEGLLAEVEKEEPEKKEERKEETKMEYRKKFFNLSAQERDAFIERADVKEFLQRTRELGSQKRSITGAELLIPTVVLDLIRENVLRYSKLYRHVRVRAVPGKARQTVMGAIPEAVWTEACATLNELNLSFAGVEVDGFKVGGYIAVCNATLQDSDIALAEEIISALGQAIGLALDKAILYGTGTKMPLGVVTRLTQTSAPASAPANSIAWTNLSATNVLAISGKTDAALFKALVTATGAAKGVYSRGEKVWVMNEQTYTTLIANALTINAGGAIVAGVEGTMPVIGGVIEVLPFIPNDVIIGGYFDLYLLAERAGTTIAQSEHAMFIEDQTVFKGTARYDGLPVVAEAFVAIGISGTAPTANAVTFAVDQANTVSGS